jgi:hypothetical protein
MIAMRPDIIAPMEAGRLGEKLFNERSGLNV